MPIFGRNAICSCPGEGSKNVTIHKHAAWNLTQGSKNVRIHNHVITRLEG
jgi:hypothetical protein